VSSHLDSITTSMTTTSDPTKDELLAWQIEINEAWNGQLSVFYEPRKPRNEGTIVEYPKKYIHEMQLLGYIYLGDL